MKIEVPDLLYKQYQQLIRQRFHSEDVAAYVQQLIEFELRKYCTSGYETDGLTGCKTCYQLDWDINRATWGSSWQDRSVFKNKYLCLDIHNFKSFLDNNGLTAGDEVLKEISRQLHRKHSDANVYRFGGDEFVVELGERRHVPLQVPSGINLKYAIVKVSAQRNQHRNHYINRVIIFHLDKGIVEATQKGKEIVCEITAI
jgi:diguanylate cyclase (GGDEF)-like protein